MQTEVEKVDHKSNNDKVHHSRKLNSKNRLIAVSSFTTK